jgi:hypothetical protein
MEQEREEWARRLAGAEEDVLAHRGQSGQEHALDFQSSDLPSVKKGQ